MTKQNLAKAQYLKCTSRELYNLGIIEPFPYHGYKNQCQGQDPQPRGFLLALKRKSLC